MKEQALLKGGRADRRPARCARWPAIKPLIAIDLRLLELHQRQHFRREMGSQSSGMRLAGATNGSVPLAIWSVSANDAQRLAHEDVDARLPAVQT